jgi:hypothetical protein
MNLVRTGLCIATAALIATGVNANARSSNANALANRERTLTGLETQVRILREDDRQAIADAVSRVGALDGEVAEGLQQRGRPVAPPPLEPLAARSASVGADDHAVGFHDGIRLGAHPEL